MTLKEIKKLIDKSHLILIKNTGYTISFSISVETNKENLISAIFHYVNECKSFVYFYIFDEKTGELTLLAKVDHIDKKMKVIKKKLGEMTNEETNQVKQKICFDRKACTGCPLRYKSVCLATYFKVWKNLIKETENREFEVEVEE